MIRSSKKNYSPSKSRKRAALAAFLLILVIIMMILIKRYQSTLPNMPQNTSSPAPSTVKDTKQEEPAEIRKYQLKEEDRQFLIDNGLKDPINDLVQNLMKHNELIPCKGEVGGTPGFYDSDRITVLNKDHVLANYDDGHVEGTIELTFNVSNGRVSWKVVKAECGD